MPPNRPKKVELLAPAGNFEKLEIAIHYGADAVYLGGKDFSLRNFSGNFTVPEIKTAVTYAHERGVKVYVACNIFSRNHEQKPIYDFLLALKDVGPDAVIISDPGTLMMARETIPTIPMHLSTQANTTNFRAAAFWQKNGVKRINVARELSLEEIKEISSKTTMGIEAFVHGAMCISYSGRCLLSSFMANRDSNRGMCCHPCRFEYAVVEALRPGQYYPLAEDGRGSYVFNSKDLCMIEHIPQMIAAGIESLKIEGRMKGIHYLATTVKAYRAAIDAYSDSPETYNARQEWIESLHKIGNRGYCTGFYMGDPDQTPPNDTGSKLEGHSFIAKAFKKIDGCHTEVDVRNKFYQSETIEIVTASGPDRPDYIHEIRNQNNEPIGFAQPGSRVTIKLRQAASQNDLIRKVAS
jgi:putative protease